MISVIAYVYPAPEKKELAVEAAKELVKNVKNEEGTLFYSLNIEDKNPDVLVFMEKYKDMDAFTFHGQTDHFKEFIKKAAEFSIKPAEIKILNEVESI